MYYVVKKEGNGVVLANERGTWDLCYLLSNQKKKNKQYIVSCKISLTKKLN